MLRVDETFADWVTETIRCRGRAVIRSCGTSMLPSIPDGATMEIRPVAQDELQPGDIVAYGYAGKVFCHRLIRKSGRFCTLKGDALLAADPPVPYAQVIGRVTSVMDAHSRFRSLDVPERRRAARWMARASYPLSLLLWLRWRLETLAPWCHGVTFPEDR